MSDERTTKDSVGYIANKFAENPGHFAATILRMYWDMEKQRDQYKAEIHHCKAELESHQTNLKQRKEALEYTRTEVKKYKTERDNCLKDIDQLRKALIKTQNLADELMEYQVKYTTLTNHIRLKAENNPGVSRYIDLVNYIDRLEKGEG